MCNTPKSPNIGLGNDMGARHDLRRQNRVDCSLTVKIMWCDSSGHDKFANATALDISELGMRLKVPEALRVQSSVTLRSEKLRLQGEASVRHCSRLGTNYAVGFEFSRGVRWVPAAQVPAPK
jgi:hypothetical protein